MAVTRDVYVMASYEGGLVELSVDWDYDDVNQVGVKVYGVRVNNQTARNLVYKLWVYGNDKGSTRSLLHESEHQPGTDTGMVVVGPLTVRSGGFNFAFQPLRYAP